MATLLISIPSFETRRAGSNAGKVPLPPGTSSGSAGNEGCKSAKSGAIYRADFSNTKEIELWHHHHSIKPLRIGEGIIRGCDRIGGGNDGAQIVPVGRG